MDNQWLTVAFSSFILWTSLMLAFGPQSALILKQGIRKHGLITVLVVVIISDFFLAALGISGVSAMLERAPWLVTGLRWGGVVYILWFASTCFRDGLHPRVDTSKNAPVGNDAAVYSNAVHSPLPLPNSDNSQSQASHRPLSATSPVSQSSIAIAVAEAPARTSTPLTLIRTATQPGLTAFAITWFNPNAYVDSILLGSLSIHHPGMDTAIFVGAMCGTCLWFPSFGFAAHKLSGQLAKPHIWAKLNLAIGVIMVFLALRLAIGG
ncbi:LysE family transporter [Corynebacterium sp. 4HC-13]|uniref:LysE/ArgO family amino acid transporter n=1 Tax=Corynebacterium anserum TaxID=2684406 RepID=UPI00163B0183|nr:LysE family transporter [Corynebacterium anserum]MBC2681846.1 LysE family transporter [Corynebacterium anserum]